MRCGHTPDNKTAERFYASAGVVPMQPGSARYGKRPWVGTKAWVARSSVRRIPNSVFVHGPSRKSATLARQTHLTVSPRKTAVSSREILSRKLVSPLDEGVVLGGEGF